VCFAAWHSKLLSYGAKGCVFTMNINIGSKRQPNEGPLGNLFTVVGSSQAKQFGIVPSSLVTILSDSDDDSRTRTQAADELKVLIEDSHYIHLTVPHFDDLVEFVGSLLDDDNFKVCSAAIDVFSALVRRLPKQVVASKSELLVLKLYRHLGSTYGYVRESATRTFTQLMHVASSSSVVDSLCAIGLSHRSARIRQETVNLVIIALLTFPSTDFKLERITRTVAIALIDGKRPVRQAALECCAVLAQALGPLKRSTLMQSVSEVEARNGGGTALTDAVNARLSNRKLPKQQSTGLVEYATHVNNFYGASTPTPDIEWILSASAGHGSSAKSAASDGGMSSRMSMRSQISNVPDDSQPFGPSWLRRSARRGFARLPWDIEVKCQ